MKRFVVHPAVFAVAAFVVELASALALRAVWVGTFGPGASIGEARGVMLGYWILVGSGLGAMTLGAASAYRAVLVLRPWAAAVFVAVVAAPLTFVATAATYATLAMLAWY